MKMSIKLIVDENRIRELALDIAEEKEPPKREPCVGDKDKAHTQDMRGVWY